MKIIDPYIEVEPYDGVQIMKDIELACRNCYRSEGNITKDSYKNLLKNCINRGHESVLEHRCIMVRMTCDIGVYKDLTRHRAGASFSIESTRYCNYGKDKFENELKFIKPIFYEQRYADECSNDADIKNSIKYHYWQDCMEDIECTYLQMSRCGCTPDELRMLLPHSTAAQVVMTCNIREWKHILSLRASKHTHPSIQQLMIPLLLKFKEDMPEIFDTVEYNTEFPKEKYAEVKVLNKTEV